MYLIYEGNATHSSHDDEGKYEIFENALLTMKHCKMLLTMYIKNNGNDYPHQTTEVYVHTQKKKRFTKHL